MSTITTPNEETSPESAIEAAPTSTPRPVFVRAFDRIAAAMGSKAAKLRRLQAELAADQEQAEKLANEHWSLKHRHARCTERLRIAKSKIPGLERHREKAAADLRRWLASGTSTSITLIEAGNRHEGISTTIKIALEAIGPLEDELKQATDALRDFESNNGDSFVIPGNQTLAPSTGNPLFPSRTT